MKQLINLGEAWLSGSAIIDHKIKNGKLIIKVSDGEFVKLHKSRAKVQKIKYKLPTIKYRFKKINLVLIHFNGQYFITDEVPLVLSKAASSVLYSIDILITLGASGEQVIKVHEVVDMRGCESMISAIDMIVK